MKSENQRIIDYLKGIFNQYEKAEKDILASNQQLQASEQQLKASNQQLQASEQQLKASNQELKTSVTKYRALFEFSPYGIVVANKDWQYLDANQRICEMLGYTREEFIGMHATQIVVPAEESRIDPNLYEKVKSVTGYSEIWEFLRKDGTTFIAEVIASNMLDGNPIGVIRDITDWLQIEKELKDHRINLEEKIIERTKELDQKNKKLEDFNKLFIGRELRIKELRDEVEKLESKIQQIGNS